MQSPNAQFFSLLENYILILQYKQVSAELISITKLKNSLPAYCPFKEEERNEM